MTPQPLPDLAGGAGELDLAQLAIAARTSAAAREELVALTHRRVRRFATAFSGPDHGEDITQETFIRAIGSLHRYDPEQPFLPWLLTIARRVAIDEIRRNERRHRLLDRLRQQPIEEGQAESGGVADLVRRLEPQRRLAFVLTQVLGYDYEQAARIARCPVGSIRSRVHRARAELVSAMERSDRA